MYVGALLGAQHGVSGIPQEWRDKTTGWAELQRQAESVASA
jgi:ADP-ribosylglycohydrolase